MKFTILGEFKLCPLKIYRQRVLNCLIAFYIFFIVCVYIGVSKPGPGGLSIKHIFDVSLSLTTISGL